MYEDLCGSINSRLAMIGSIWVEGFDYRFDQSRKVRLDRQRTLRGPLVSERHTILMTIRHLPNQKRKHLHQRLPLLYIRDVQNVHRERRHNQRRIARRDLENRTSRYGTHIQRRDPILLRMCRQCEQRS